MPVARRPRTSTRGQRRREGSGTTGARVAACHPMTMTSEGETRTAIRTCPLCEAGCGLEITLRGDEVLRIRGDRDDVFSHGYICPKGSTLKQLHEDPDRVRAPLIKRGGRFVEATWDEAFAEIERRLLPILEAHGRDSAAA